MCRSWASTAGSSSAGHPERGNPIWRANWRNSASAKTAGILPAHPSPPSSKSTWPLTWINCNQWRWMLWFIHWWSVLEGRISKDLCWCLCVCVCVWNQDRCWREQGSAPVHQSRGRVRIIGQSGRRGRPRCGDPGGSPPGDVADGDPGAAGARPDEKGWRSIPVRHRHHGPDPAADVHQPPAAVQFQVPPSSDPPSLIWLMERFPDPERSWTLLSNTEFTLTLWLWTRLIQRRR